jgi:SAM-dependent methyltransferase
VEGLDLVPEVVARARERLAERKLSALVEVGDIETVELSGRYDVFVLSWFCYAYLPESSRRIGVLEKLAAHLAPRGRILLSYVPAGQARSRRAFRVTRAVARLTRTSWRPEAGDSVAIMGDGMSSVTFQHFFHTGEAEEEARAAGLRVLAQEPIDQVMTMALATAG